MLECLSLQFLPVDHAMPSTLVEAESLDVFKMELVKQKILVLSSYYSLTPLLSFNHSIFVCRAAVPTLYGYCVQRAQSNRQEQIY